MTLRLEPRLRFALNLLARKRRRSMASIMEYALYKAIEDSADGLFRRTGGTDEDLLELTWDPEEADRFVKTGLHWRHIFTYEEELLWKVIQEDRKFWKGEKPDFIAIRKQWHAL